MATPTPLLKGLITVTIISGALALSYNLYKKHSSETNEEAQIRKEDVLIQTEKLEAPHSVTNNQSIPEKQATVKFTNNQTNFASSAIGTTSNPLKVSIVSFHGYAPGIVANGSSFETKQNSIFAKAGVSVKYLLQDDIPTLSTLFESKIAHCAWRTSDFWAQEQPNLRNAGLDARAVMVVDNTQGADAIITNKPNINTIEDLAGKKVALLQFTPSHGMIIDAIENSSMTAKKKNSVNFVYINAEEGTAGVRAALESGAVDAVALWDPDLSLTMKNVRNSKIIYSTKTATNLIYDVIVCDKKVIDSKDGQEAIQRFVNGWMSGIQYSKANPDIAVDALVQTQELFSLLAKKEGKPFIKSLFNTLVWTDVEQNARILGLNGQQGHYNRVYTRFDRIYRDAGALANPKSPVIPPQESVDTRFIQKLLDKDIQAQQSMVKPEFTFSESTKEKIIASKAPEVTKPIIISFATNSADLTKRAESIIDKELVPFIENNGSAYFEISGHTDSVGSIDANMKLSAARGLSVAKYLVNQWEFPSSRFKIVGYGPTKPICNENNPTSEGLNLEQCQSLNRSVRVAVYGSK